LTIDFYTISLKRNFNGKLQYGQKDYDFSGGMLTFMSPKQVLSIENEKNATKNQYGFLLLIHPDFLWNTSLAKTIKQYQYFNYAVNEALFLSDKEEATINILMKNIEQEYQSNIDTFRQNIIISQIETLLHYSERFYQRQFITRKINNHQILDKLEELLNDYFNNEDLSIKGLPSVHYIAETLNVSPNYLSGLLKALTQQSTQQYIHDKLIEKAKEKLSTTSLSVSEIAYQLGFEHPQSFHRLFKNRTSVSPLEFRQSFN